MTREEIKNKVTAIVADKIGFPVSEIEESTRFKADLGTDTLDDIELLMEFERVFGIKIPDEEMTGIVTVGDVINGLAARFGVVVEVKENPNESEDERIRKFLIGYFDVLVDENSEWGLAKETRSKIIAYLEKHKEQPSEWSEEDERMLKAIIGGLGCIQKAGCERFGGEEMGDVILWIKNRFQSLRPQPHWKPSDEQMKMLESLPDLLREFKLDTSAQMLEVLREQLKKVIVYGKQARKH